MSQNSIVMFVCLDQYKATLNKLFGLHGMAFVAAASQTGAEPATGWFGFHTSMSPAEEAALRGLRETLPEIPSEEDWDEEDLGPYDWPTEEQALEAVQHFGLYVCDDPTKTNEQKVATVLAGWGLKVVEIDLG